jgi:subtilisin family serine protease
MPLRILDDVGEGYFADLIDAIYYAVDHGAQVINLSLGGYSSGCDGLMAQTLSYAQDGGLLVVAASGNDGDESWFDPADPGNWFYPAACEDVLGVGATTSLDQRAPFSNYGPWVDVSAPGVGIESTYPYGSYASISGTSMATPFASGLAALIYAKHPTASPDAVAAAIMAGADDLGPAGWDPYYGAGRIHAARALSIVDLSAVADLRGFEGTAGSQPRRSEEIDAARAPFRPGELIVRLKGTPAAAGLAASEVLQASRAPGVYLIRVPVGQELARARALRAQGGVLDVQPNYILSAAGE